MHCISYQQKWKNDELGNHYQNFVEHVNLYRNHYFKRLPECLGNIRTPQLSHALHNIKIIKKYNREDGRKGKCEEVQVRAGKASRVRSEINPNWIPGSASVTDIEWSDWFGVIVFFHLFRPTWDHNNHLENPKDLETSDWRPEIFNLQNPPETKRSK